MEKQESNPTLAAMTSNLDPQLLNLSCRFCAKETFLSFEEADLHYRGKAHTKKIRLADSAVEKQIFIGGIASIPSTSVLEYISCFGKLDGLNYVMSRSIDNPNQPNIMFAHFLSEESVQSILALPSHVVNGWRFNISARIVLDLVTGVIGADNQILAATQMVALGEPHLKKRAQVCEKIENILNQFHPGFRAFAFGSAGSSLALIGSDLDILIEFDYNKRLIAKGRKEFWLLREKPKASNSIPTDPVIPDVGAMTVGVGESSAKDEDKIHDANKIKLIFEVMKRNRSIFRNIFPVLGARVPLLKFIHGPTGLTCDVNCRNRMGYLNSQYIKTILTWDDKLRPLLLFLKFWAKHHELIGRGNTGCHTSYAFVVLVLFFLQHEAIIPSPIDLQAAHPEAEEIVSGWSCGFGRDLSVLKPTRRRIESLWQTMAEFFEFVTDLNYAEYFMCGRSGKLRPKSELAETLGIDPALIAEFYPWVLIDPFELNRTITKTLIGQALERFLHFCRQAKSHLISSDSLNDPEITGLFHLKPFVPSSQAKGKKKPPKNTISFKGRNALTPLLTKANPMFEMASFMDQIFRVLFRDCLLLESFPLPPKSSETIAKAASCEVTGSSMVEASGHSGDPHFQAVVFEITMSSNESDNLQVCPKNQTNQPEHFVSLSRCRAHLDTWSNRPHPSLNEASEKRLELYDLEVRRAQSLSQAQVLSETPLLEFDLVVTVLDDVISLVCNPVGEPDAKWTDFASFLATFLSPLCTSVLYQSSHPVLQQLK
eukprot:snap_masked-scaffold711_size108467-processed-gene-0.14 protein:Tk04242 transcript:snap_masked-scaffold711_size108467-processed-gene-0.14-mRNA-1 annotation:"speckle targeted pip5k1a-regulated poly polymerase-like"